jgi:hypothetical protein
MNIYLDNGYLDIDAIRRLGLPFNFIVGGRGTGKTYGALKNVIDKNIRFMLMRRTQAQADMINKPEFSPFKKLNTDLNINIVTKPISKYNSGFYLADNEGKPAGNAIGYTCALSTVSNIRGFDASDIELLIFDEFIPERHERPIKNEGAAFLNAYETMNRNRELNGEKPLQVLCLANANDLANPIFMELGMVRKADNMRKKGQEVSINKDKGYGIFLLNRSPISQEKRDTALYKLTEGSEFTEMSLDNDFLGVDNEKIVSRPLNEYKPIVTVGEITIYKHKNGGKLYVSTHETGSPPKYSSTEAALKRFNFSYNWLRMAYYSGIIEFEEYLCESLFLKYIKNA